MQTFEVNGVPVPLSKKPSCFDGEKHIGPLSIIYRVEVDQLETHVVRWCKQCGAIVVDVDVDGKTYPGRIKEMTFPAKI